MPRTRDAKHRLPPEAESSALRLRKLINPPGPTVKRRRVPGSGRRKGGANHIPKYTQAVILEALHTYGKNGTGRGGIIGLLHGAFRQDIRHAISLLITITPKILEQNITRTAEVLLSIEDVDRSLRQAGLPTTSEVFRLDWRGSDPVEEDTEGELATEAESAPSK